MSGQSPLSGQPALPYTGGPPSQYPNNFRGQPIPQSQLAAHYDGTPPYTENSYTAGPSPTSAPRYSSDAVSTAAPPSYKASADLPSSARLLHVYHSGMLHRKIHILGPDKATVLYTIKPDGGSLFSSKPDVTVYRNDTSTVVGTVTFHSFSRSIDLVIHNNPIALASMGLFTSAHEWTSLATTAEGNPMRFIWKSDHGFNGGDMICLDQQRKICAKFEASMWALQKDGKFEVGPFVSVVVIDEVIVTGLAMLELRKRSNS